MIEIQFSLQELSFLMESAKSVTIRGIDAPLVAGVMAKIQTAAEAAQKPQEKEAVKPVSKK